MAPRDDSIQTPGDTEANGIKLTAGFRRYPPNRDVTNKSPDGWLQGKIEADDAWPYWRVHDKLYDLKEFISTHPGGSYWLESTRGSDITELFESSHFGPRPYDFLKKFYVEDAKTPRNSPFTFEEDGFYMTLKKKVTPILLKEGKGANWFSYLIQDGMLSIHLFFLLSAGWYHSYICAIIAGMILALTAIAAHNFTHQKNSWRMYIFDITLQTSREFRISHIISHHCYPNTIYDYEVSNKEPILHLLARLDVKPNYIVYNLQLIVKWLLITFQRAFLGAINRFMTANFSFTSIIPFLHMMSLAIVAQSLTVGLCLWVVLQFVTAFFMLLVGVTTGHHDPDAYHEGDNLPKSLDWGVFQLCAQRERSYTLSSVFLASVSFGNHMLHHLFPTVDFVKLPLLLDSLMETLDEFGIEFKSTTQWEQVKGFYKLLLMLKCNDKLPSILKKYKRMKNL